MTSAEASSLPSSPAIETADRDEDLVARKTALRRAARVRRAELADSRAGQNLADALLASGLLDPAACVAAFWPMGNEIDPRPAIEALLARGRVISLPVVVGPERPLIFRRWREGDPLVEGGFGTHIPGSEAPEVTPEVLLVPLLAFDRRGYRLGYGGGFYDRTLAALRRGGRPVRAIGIAYAGQEVAEVPRDEHDQPLNAIVTDQGQIPLTGAEAASVQAGTV